MVKTRDGRRVHVDPDDPRALELVRAGGHPDPVALALWRRLQLAHNWDLVVAAGVGYGEALVGAPPPPDADVVVLEPEPWRHPYLRRTFADNALRRARLRSEAVTLDEVVGPWERSFCVRVDGAGSAAALLRGASAVLRWTGPWVLMLAVAPDGPGAADPGSWPWLPTSHEVLALDAAAHALVPVAEVSPGSSVHRGHVVVAAPSIVDALLDGLV